MAIEKEQPIESSLRVVMNDIGHVLDLALQEATQGLSYKYGFCLLMFATGEHPEEADMRMNYICNVDRQDTLAAMKEFIARNEGRYEEINPAKRRQ
jgi:hypothetical protein